MFRIEAYINQYLQICAQTHKHDYTCLEYLTSEKTDCPPENLSSKAKHTYFY